MSSLDLVFKSEGPERVAQLDPETRRVKASPQTWAMLTSR